MKFCLSRKSIFYLTSIKRFFFFIYATLFVSETILCQNVDLTTLHKNASYHLSKNPDSTRYYLELAKRKTNNTNSKELAGNLNLWGSYYLNQKKLDSAIISFESALTLFNEQKDSINLAKSYNGIAAAANIKGNYTLAVSNFHKALKILEKLQAGEPEVSVSYNLGMVYVHMKNYSKANTYLHKALKKANSTGFKSMKSYTLGALANLHIRNKQADSANFYLSKYRTNLNDALNNHSFINLEGRLQLLKGDTDEALILFKKALMHQRFKEEPENEVLLLCDIAKAYLVKNEATKAIAHLASADALLEKSYIPYLKRDLDSLYSASYFFIKQIDKADSYLRNYARLRDSLLNVQKVYEVDYIEEQFQENRKRKIFNDQQDKIRVQKEKNRNLVIGIILASISFFFLISFLQKRKKKIQQEKKVFENLYHSLKDDHTALSEKLLKVSKKLAETATPKASKKYEKSNMTEDRRQRIMEQLLQYMKEERPYLDTELSLQSLSKQIGIKPYQLSEVLSLGLSNNFYGFVNLYRVEVAKKILKNDTENLTMLAVAFDAGFNSKASFNRVFKNVTGVTPTFFKKEVALVKKAIQD